MRRPETWPSHKYKAFKDHNPDLKIQQIISGESGCEDNYQGSFLHMQRKLYKTFHGFKGKCGKSYQLQTTDMIRCITWVCLRPKAKSLPKTWKSDVAECLKILSLFLKWVLSYISVLSSQYHSKSQCDKCRYIITLLVTSIWITRRFIQKAPQVTFNCIVPVTHVWTAKGCCFFPVTGIKTSAVCLVAFLWVDNQKNLVFLLSLNFE